MAQLTRVKPPRFVKKLIDALASEMPGADIDVERVPGANRYRLAVVWDGFTKRNLLRRQDKVWEIADAVLDREELLKISIILTYRPEDLEIE